MIFICVVSCCRAKIRFPWQEDAYTNQNYKSVSSLSLSLISHDPVSVRQNATQSNAEGTTMQAGLKHEHDTRRNRWHSWWSNQTDDKAVSGPWAPSHARYGYPHPMLTDTLTVVELCPIFLPILTFPSTTLSRVNESLDDVHQCDL